MWTIDTHFEIFFNINTNWVLFLPVNLTVTCKRLNTKEFISKGDHNEREWDTGPPIRNPCKRYKPPIQEPTLCTWNQGRLMQRVEFCSWVFPPQASNLGVALFPSPTKWGVWMNHFWVSFGILNSVILRKAVRCEGNILPHLWPLPPPYPWCFKALGLETALWN